LALFATEVTDIRPAASWPFGLVLLGLAAVLIATAAGFPDFFAAGLGQFGVEAP
jgi:hypothetical protein